MKFRNLQTTSHATPEKIFNLFLFDDGGIIREFGAVFHKTAGTEAQKLEHLKSKVKTDVPNARRFPVPEHLSIYVPIARISVNGALTNQAFRFLVEGGKQLQVFEAAFEAMNAPRAPLFCITFVVNGHVHG